MGDTEAVEPRSALFTAEEWEVIVPNFSAAEEDEERPLGLRSTWKRPNDDSGVDNEAETRPLPPLTPLADLAPFPRLRSAVAFERTVLGIAIRGFLYLPCFFLGWIGFGLPLLASTFVFNNGRFSDKHLAVGFAAMAFSTVYVFVLYVVFMLSLPGVPAIYANVLQGAANWHKLVVKGTSPLLAHRETQDRKCPCPLPSCSGRLTTGFGWAHWVYTAVMLVAAQFSTTTFAFWTPLISFSSSVWGSAWAVPAALVLVFTAATNLVTCLTSNIGNASLIELANRVQTRAVNIALRSTMEGLHARLYFRLDSNKLSLSRHEHPHHTTAEQSIDNELKEHSRLYMRLIGRWRRASSDLNRPRALFVALFPGWVIPGVIYAAGSGCINVFVVSCIAFAAVLILVDLAVIAASNEGPGRAAAEYRAASMLLRELSARARAAGDAELAADACDFRRVFDAYADVGDVRAKLLGFPVSWAVLRSLVVGFATLFIGMWTLLKSAGITLTIESFCPG
ncbi:hypothetical protein DFJ74DRAFT_259792 [Hyaloraphidium curvatum]|nr:hypothetical protein DFJ74DRAFT_259792 [Hyaloraphidium curvatum]